MANNTIKNNYILYSINVEDAQNVEQTRSATRLNKPFGQEPFASPTCILARTGDTIDRDLTDSEIKKTEERLGDYLPDWFDLPRSNVSCEKKLNDKTG